MPIKRNFIQLIKPRFREIREYTATKITLDENDELGNICMLSIFGQEPYVSDAAQLIKIAQNDPGKFFPGWTLKTKYLMKKQNIFHCLIQI